MSRGYSVRLSRCHLIYTGHMLGKLALQCTRERAWGGHCHCDSCVARLVVCTDCTHVMAAIWQQNCNSTLKSLNLWVVTFALWICLDCNIVWYYGTVYSQHVRRCTVYIDETHSILFYSILMNACLTICDWCIMDSWGAGSHLEREQQ